MFNRSRTTIALLIAISFTVAGCTDEPISEGPSENAVPDPTLNKSPENAQNDFSPRLIEIANEYLSYSLVDQHVQWAPAACAPLRVQPLLSTVAAPTTHRIVGSSTSCLRHNSTPTWMQTNQRAR